MIYFTECQLLTELTSSTRRLLAPAVLPLQIWQIVIQADSSPSTISSTTVNDPSDLTSTIPAVDYSGAIVIDSEDSEDSDDLLSFVSAADSPDSIPKHHISIYISLRSAGEAK